MTTGPVHQCLAKRLHGKGHRTPLGTKALALVTKDSRRTPRGIDKHSFFHSTVNFNTMMAIKQNFKIIN